MSANRDTVLDIRNLSIEFRTDRGRLKALRNVTLSVPKEKIVGLVGESGCGKSTVIFSVINLLAENAEVTGGVVEFEGRDILKMSQNDLRALCVSSRPDVVTAPSIAPSEATGSTDRRVHINEFSLLCVFLGPGNARGDMVTGSFGTRLERASRGP